MGAYLSSPVTDKLSDDKTAEKLSYGASAMQGWRLSMEDAHNCILSLDDETAMFGVYDGHGGAEVAIYCAQHLPDFIVNSKAYKEGNLNKALEDAFMEFDATLTQGDVVRELKHIAGNMGELEGEEKTKEQKEEEREEAALLAEEATLPLAELLVKYGQQLKDHSKTKALRKKMNPDDLLSPVIRKTQSRINPLSEAVSGDKDNNGKSCDSEESINKQTNKEETENKQIQSDSDQSEKKDNETCNGNSPHTGSGDSNELELTKKQTTEQESEEKPGQSSDIGNGDVDDDEDEDDEEYNDEVDEEEEEGECDDDDEDEDDSDDDEDDEEDEDDDEEEDDENGLGRVLGVTDKDEPGSDSGCTAVVALVRGNQLVVGNAGDSRCIVSRGGIAVDMSLDHKPEDEPERNRIENAGGKVTMDGRVNGGLNLSRAIGDHCYKQNQTLPPEEQMITAFPDIQTITLNSQDNFMVVACDGIWNVMTSQEVVDFVQKRLDQAESEKEGLLSSICEEMFDYCLAPDTKGDGTGCDNMTCMIVRFHDNGVSSHSQSEKSLKRPVSPDSTSSSTKRSKN